MEPSVQETLYKLDKWYLRETDNDITLQDENELPAPPQHWYPQTHERIVEKPLKKRWHTAILPLPKVIDFIEYLSVVRQPSRHAWFVDAIKSVDNMSEDPQNNSYKHIKRFYGGNKCVLVQLDPARVKGCDRLLVHFYSFDSIDHFPAHGIVGWVSKFREDVSLIED